MKGGELYVGPIRRYENCSEKIAEGCGYRCLIVSITTI